MKTVLILFDGSSHRRDTDGRLRSAVTTQGFYQLCTKDRSMLVIGPYQGSHGCLRIPVGRGVCGIAAQKRETQLVANVHDFPGHIACSST